MDYWYLVPQVALMLVGAIIIVMLGIHAWRHRDAAGATAFVWVSVVSFEWSLSDTLLFLSVDPADQLFWTKAKYLSIVAFPVVWLALALQYTGQRRWLERKRLLLMLVIPLVTAALAWTNETHHLIWERMAYYRAGALLIPDRIYGGWFWIHIAYSYFLLALGAALMVRKVLKSPRPFSRQAVALLLAVTIPFAANIVYVFRLAAWMRVEPSPFLLPLIAMALSWGLFRQGLFDLSPVARDAAVEGMSDGMIALDVQGRIVDLNPAAQQITGVSAREAIGQSAAFHLANWPSQIIHFQSERDEQLELELLQDGDLHHYDVRVSPLFDRRKRLTGRLIVMRDITERQRAAELLHQQTLELQARNDELDAFASTVAHDLKNPLTLFIGYAEVLADDFGSMPDEELSALLQNLVRGGHKMERIIDSLLLLSTVRKAEVDLEPLDMANIVDQALQRERNLIEKQQAAITVPDFWPLALGFPAWVEEVWVNYLSNALKYGGSPPRIDLGASVLPVAGKGDMVKFWMRDNGAGLRMEDRERIFAPFTRLGQDEVQGHGLGLSIVRRIVEKLGGQVQVESQVGKGSVFSFTLPAIESV